MKRLLALMIALGMLAASIGVLADTPQEAEALAKAQVPATALLTDTNSNNNRYEFTFEDRVACTASLPRCGAPKAHSRWGSMKSRPQPA